MSENEIRAKAVRETAAYIDRIHKNGLVPLGKVLADMAAVAYRMEQGMTARGSMRTAAEVRSTDTTKHDRDRMGICRRCGQGITAKDLLDGEERCDTTNETKETK